MLGRLVLAGGFVFLGGCLSNPFPMCDGPRPDCIATCPGPAFGCVGTPTGQAECIDEDGDVHWYCWEGLEVTACDVIRTECVDTFDGGVNPSDDAGAADAGS